MKSTVTKQPENDLRSLRPIFLSVFTHFVLVAVVLVSLSQVPSPRVGESIRQAGIVLVAENAIKAEEYLTEREKEQVGQKELDSESPNPTTASISSESNAPSVRKLENSVLPGASPIESNNDVEQMSTAIKNSSVREFELSKEDLERIEAEQKLIRSQQPAGPAVSIRIFGSEDISGRRFVFVLDRSKSMGSGGLGVIDQAQIELKAAIDKLEPHHHFQIVAYNDRISSIGKREMLQANDANKRFAPGFIQNLVAYGGTNHERGLIAAMSFRPDVVILLTDGASPDLNAGQLKAIKLIARRGVQVHAFQFGKGPLQESNNFMMRLARQNSGSYRYIDVRSWSSNN